MKLIHEYLVDDSKIDIINNLDENLSEIRKIAENPLNYYVLQNKNGFSIPSEFTDKFDDFITSLASSTNYIDEIKFFSDYEAIEGEDTFWQTVKGFCHSFNKNRQSINFMNDLNDIEFEQCVKDLFFDYILFTAPVVAKEKFSLDQTVSILNALTTCNNIIIVRRFPKIAFYDFVFKRFGFSKSRAEFIWQLFINNKSDLQFAYLVNELDENKEAMMSLKSIFSMIENSDDYDDSDSEDDE